MSFCDHDLVLYQTSLSGSRKLGSRDLERQVRPHVIEKRLCREGRVVGEGLLRRRVVRRLVVVVRVGGGFGAEVALAVGAPVVTSGEHLAAEVAWPSRGHRRRLLFRLGLLFGRALARRVVSLLVHVDDQPVSARKRLTAHATHVRLLAAVDAHVDHQTVLARQRLAAHGADKVFAVFVLPNPRLLLALLRVARRRVLLW